jgi:DNA-binding MarR family transcriptional regulator
MTEHSPLQAAATLTYQADSAALLFIDDPIARDRTGEMLCSLGIRLTAKMPVSAARARLDEQVSVGLAWVELTGRETKAQLEDLLGSLDRRAEEGTAIVVATPIELVDLVDANLHHRHAEILVNVDDAQRLGALATVLSDTIVEKAVSDVGKDNAARLRQLSDEMGRIAATLARLSTGPGSPAVKPGESRAPAPDVDAETIRSVIRARRLRARFFSEELFADPAWDMLLDLLQAEIAQLRVPVSSLCIAAAVPATTALRWIKTMTEQGLFVRRADPHDGRRVFVELAPSASDAMRRYFGDVAKPIVV